MVRVPDPVVREVTRTDGSFRIVSSSDGSTAHIEITGRGTGGGKPITREAILERLGSENISHGVDQNAIEELLQRIDADDIPDEPILIAKGDVEHGEDGVVEWCMAGADDQQFCLLVSAGARVAVSKPATQGRPGKNIFGKKTQPRAGIEKPLSVGEGIDIERGEGGELTYLTSRAGVLKFDAGDLSVGPGLVVSEDKIQAHMDIPVGPTGGQQITRDDILATLAHAGIRHGILADHIAAAFNQANGGARVVEKVLVAQGNAPVHGRDGAIEWFLAVDAQEPDKRAVLPGQLIAIRTPATQATPGRNIYGEILPARDGAAYGLESGSGVARTEAAGRYEYRAQWLGLVEFDQSVLTVRADLNVSEEQMQATLGLFPSATSLAGSEVSLDHVLTTLTEHGINSGIDEDRISSALAAAKASGQAHIDLVVAEGIPPRDGAPIQLDVDTELAAGKLLPDGKIDFHERSYPWNVKVGDVLGCVMPARPAEDGKKINGESIPAKPAAVLTLQLDGMERRVDGRLIALRDGVLLAKGLNLKVADSLVINGNVCLETGNIRSHKTVVVNGHVDAGFVVDVQGDTVVQHNVEDATVTATGDVVIKGGIRGTHSNIISKGDITAGFAENASLLAKGDIDVKSAAIGCDMVCGQVVTIGGARSTKAVLIGGVTKALKGVEVAIAGSNAYPRTVIRVGVGRPFLRRFKKLEKALKAKKTILDELDQACSRLEQQALPKRKKLIKKITRTRTALKNEHDELLVERDAMERRIKEAKKAEVKIHQRVYPGVRIRILNASYRVTEEQRAGVFHLDGEHIIFEPKVLRAGAR